MARQLYDTWECGQYAESHTECIILLSLLKSGRLKYRREGLCCSHCCSRTGYNHCCSHCWCCSHSTLECCACFGVLCFGRNARSWRKSRTRCISDVFRKKGLKFEHIAARNPCRSSGDLSFLTSSSRGQETASYMSWVIGKT